MGSAGAQRLRVRIEATGGATYGPADAPITLAGDGFEIVRAITGRRSVDQLRKLDWRGASDADIDRLIAAFSFGPFRPSAQPIDE